LLKTKGISLTVMSDSAIPFPATNAIVEPVFGEIRSHRRESGMKPGPPVSGRPSLSLLWAHRSQQLRPYRPRPVGQGSSAVMLSVITSPRVLDTRAPISSWRIISPTLRGLSTSSWTSASRTSFGGVALTLNLMAILTIYFLLT
jgi:hypothetical protein